MTRAAPERDCPRACSAEPGGPSVKAGAPGRALRGLRAAAAVAALGILLHSSAPAFDPVLAGKLQAKLDSLRTAYAIRGISASVVLPYEGLWQGVAGLSHAGVPITREMEFGIGSNTKLFTAVALLKLVEAGRIGIDDSLRAWLPPVANVDPNTTVRQLLNHTSGIADYTDYPGYADSILSNPGRRFTPVELLPWIGPPLFPPGAGGAYSNSNYLLAGVLFQNASGTSLARFLRDSVLDPLRLDSTFFDVEERVLGTVAHPWQNGVDIGGIPRVSLNSAAWAAGAMYSTSGEMADWYRRLMSGQVLDSSSFRLMTTFAGPGQYGLGIGRQVVNGRTVWGYGGDIRGYRSRMMYDTTLKAVLCVLTNTNPLPVNEVAGGLLATLAANYVTGVEDPPRWRDGANALPAEFALEQNYPNPFNGETTVAFAIPEGGRVVLEVRDLLGRRVATLLDEHRSAGRHRVRWAAGEAASGVYVYTLRIPGSRISRKLVLMR